VVRLFRFGAVFGFAVLLPVVASAQAAISGVVRDPSGGVLPGVTVEATSPALIEKVRSSVTTGTGQYAIENLPPGTYTVKFTLPGFAVVLREGIRLQGTFNARINADLQVSTVQETITVTGDPPIVDVVSTEQQRVIDREVLDTLPTAGRRTALAVLIPAVDYRSQDVGGAGAQDLRGAPTAHGARSEDAGTTLEGITIASLSTSGSAALIHMNPMAIEEIDISTGSNNAELHAGGVRTNYILKTGGNQFKGVVFGAYAPGSWQSNNLDADLMARGVATPNKIKQLWDINPAFGGPIARDKMWFYVAARYNVSADNVAGIAPNKNLNNPASWQYATDTSRRAANEMTQPDTQSRVTWQATPRNRIGFLHYFTSYCFCPGSVGVTTSPEAATWDSRPKQLVLGGDWQMPVNSKLLLDLKAQRYTAYSDTLHSDLLSQSLFVWGPNGEKGTLVPAQDRDTRLNYRAASGLKYQTQDNNSVAGWMSYLTGSHSLKVGFDDKIGSIHTVNFQTVPVSYRIRNGIAGTGQPVPDRISLSAYADPGPDGRNSKYAGWRADVDADLGIYVQDRWTLNKLTLNVGERYDYFHISYPEQRIGPSALAPKRDITFPAVKGWGLHDLSPRLSAVYDVTGEGKTALKVSLNRYVLAAGPDAGFSRLGNSSRNLVQEATRTWTDTNGNFIPDCDLTAATPGRNGECGPLSNANFGTGAVNLNFDEKAVTGFGKRQFNWEFSTGIQRQLAKKVSLDVAYFRRWYGNFDLTVDLSTTPADFDRYSVTAPLDPRLPGGGGYVINDLYDIKPALFSKPPDPLVTLSREYGKQRDYWDGGDITLNARPGPGMFFQGGLSTGRRVEDNCDIVSKVSVLAVASRGLLTTSRQTPSTLYCHRVEPLVWRLKGYGAYTIPRADVQLVATYQQRSGPFVLATYTYSSAEVAKSLGRPLAGDLTDVDIHLVSPGVYGRFENQVGGALHGETLHQVDLRVSKLLNFAGKHARLNLDIYNALNANTILRYQETFAQFMNPAEILTARVFKMSAQFDF